MKCKPAALYRLSDHCRTWKSDPVVTMVLLLSQRTRLIVPMGCAPETVFSQSMTSPQHDDTPAQHGAGNPIMVDIDVLTEHFDGSCHGFGGVADEDVGVDAGYSHDPAVWAEGDREKLGLRRPAVDNNLKCKVININKINNR